MAISDLHPGALVTKNLNTGDAHYDYSHFLHPDLHGTGWKMQVHIYPKAKAWSVHVHNGQKIVGHVTGSWSLAGNETHLSPEFASVLSEWRGRGIGTSMYEAALAHAKHALKATHLVMGDHSTPASHMYRKLALRHGLTYTPKANYDTEYDEENPDGEFDGKWAGQKVLIKSDQSEEELGKMALAFHIKKHGPRPATVYRVENEFGEGPYNPERGSRPGIFSLPLKGVSPGPIGDFKDKDRKDSGFSQVSPMDNMGQLSLERLAYRDSQRDLLNPKGRPLFGFARPEDAAHWFGGRASLQALADQGYHLRAIPASAIWLSQSGRQVMFKPHISYVPGAGQHVDLSMLPEVAEQEAYKPAKPKELHPPLRRYEGIWWLEELRKDIRDFQQVGEELGSNPGGTFADKLGQKYYFKFQPTNEHSKNEILAHKLYNAAGVGSLDMRPLKLGDGRIGTGTKWVKAQPLNLGDPDHMAQARKLFALHAWLGNWDHHVPGNMGMQNGKIAAMDLGGALLFRARGEPKPNFGNSVDEWKTLIDHDYNGFFDNMSQSDIDESVGMVAKVDDKTIDALVKEHGPGNERERKRLAAILKARRQDVLRRANEPMYKSEDSLESPVSPHSEYSDSGEFVKSEYDETETATVWTVNPQGLVLWGQRRKDGKWGVPGGHLDQGEDPATGAARELLEEAGVEPAGVMHQLGSARNGKGVLVHMFFTHTQDTPRVDNDPDREFLVFKWVDCSKGLPPDIASNLAHPDNLLLQWLGYQLPGGSGIIQ